jgi:hypothetical protein
MGAEENVVEHGNVGGSNGAQELSPRGVQPGNAGDDGVRADVQHANTRCEHIDRRSIGVHIRTDLPAAGVSSSAVGESSL